MAPTEIQTEHETQEQKETTASKPVVGIIYPPPEVRNIVDKTASFVARNGPEFETRIRQNELNNPKFNFLNPADPYHAYYQHKVKEFQEGKGREPTAPKASLLGRAPPGYPPMGIPSEQTKSMQNQLMSAVVAAAEPVIPKEPPADPEFIADPPSISAFEIDVVRLTAQFVARNGRQFVTSLMTQQQRNYQFDFLRPQHGLFNYFTRLVEQYTKILIPPKGLLQKLHDDAQDMNSVLHQVKGLVEWARFQEREKQKEEEAKEKERVAYAQIDWHDFVVVESVDFQPNEHGNLPPPTTPDEVGARVLAQERYEATPAESEMVEMEVESSGEEDDEDEDEEEEEEERVQLSMTRKQPDRAAQVQDMEEESDSDEDSGPTPTPAQTKPPLPPSLPPLPPTHTPVADSPQPPPLPPAPDRVLVRKDYDPKAMKSDTTPASDQYLISPITGEKIAADKIQEHMRIGLLDRKWTDQRDRLIASKRDQEEVYAAGSSIDSSLKQLAERRTDIFGYGVEEGKIGEKLGEEELQQREKVTWDGHTASMEKVTQKARENISIEDQIAVIHKAKGLIQDEEKERIGPARPMLNPAPTPPQPSHPTPPLPPTPQVPHQAPPKQPPMPPRPHPQQMMAPPGSRPLLPPPPPQMALPRPPPPNMMVMPQMMPPQAHMRQPMMGMPRGPPMVMQGGYGPPRRPPMQGGPPPPPPPSSHPPPPPGHKPPPGMDDDGPASKRARTEESLLPEHIFLQTHTSPVTFRVLVPNIPDKPEWKLGGQTLSLSLPLTDNISVIKAKLNEAIGMPAGKQKLQFDGLFVKDSNTLAFYNFTRETLVQLQLKERGGRKK